MNLDNCINLDDLRRAAKRRVPKVIFDFIAGGIDDEGDLTRNSNAFANRPLVPRYMTGIGNFHRDGDLMLASAARAAKLALANAPPFRCSGIQAFAIRSSPSSRRT